MVKKSILFLSVFSLVPFSIISCGKKTETTSGSGTINPPVNPQVLRISLGGDYLCGMRQGGTALCLGGNEFGQLGNGTVKDLQIEVLPVSNVTNFIQISSGFSNTCGLDANGKAWCWGSNTHGQLGNATFVNSKIPVQVSNVTGFTKISTSYALGYMEDISATTCGIANGTAWCWGENLNGQLGNGSASGSNIPVKVSTNITDFIEVAVGFNSTCALRSNGEIWCWGNNQQGQLGDGTNNDSFIPVKINDTDEFISLVGSSYTTTFCGIKVNGSAWCWGGNGQGQLGNGSGENSNIPVFVNVPTENNVIFKQLSVSDDHVCGVVSDGNTWCWGDNTYGQLGNNTTVNSNIPVKVTNSSNFIQVSVSDRHSCALTTDEQVYCWGESVDKPKNNYSTPQLLKFFPNVNAKSKKVEK